MSKINEGFKVDKSEYSKIYNTNDYLLVVPHTHTASCKYGANTKWCTTKRDDETDFEEHQTMGVLAYLIIKNPKISKEMSSEKFGLYRGNGYDLKDLIVYDELNNEHLKGINYLSNEFEKADKDLDFWKVLNAYDEYYKSMSIENIVGGKPDKLNEQISIEDIKNLCNRMVLRTKGSFGNLPKLNIVYYTKGGKIVDIEKTKGDIKAPFKLGDSIHELIKWTEENGVERELYPRKSKLREQEIVDNTDNIDDIDPTLYNICFLVLTGRLYKMDEEVWDNLISRHQSKYDNNLVDIDFNGPKSAQLIYKFNNNDDFSEYFSGNSDSYWTWSMDGRADYDYYSDSVYQDTQDENYHWIQLKKGEQLKLAKALIDKGFILPSYETAKNSDSQWGSDELSWEMRQLFEFHFPRHNENLADMYMDAAVESYAEGYAEAVKEAWNDWLNAAERLGLEEYTELEEYHLSVSKVFRYLLKPSVANTGSLMGMIEKVPSIYNSIGSSADIFSMEESRYEYQKDEPFNELQVKIKTFIDTFITEELEENEYIGEMVRENNIARKMGLNPQHFLKNTFEREIESRWGNDAANETSLKLIKKGFPKENVVKTADDKILIYLGYSVEHEGHLVYLEVEKSETHGWHPKFKKGYVGIEELATLLKQTTIKFPTKTLNEDLTEQEDNISTYYALTSSLKEYYGESNVVLTGQPAKIIIYDKHTITLDGNNLNINGSKIIVKTTKTKTINGQTVKYPIIDYITNRIGKQKKLPENFVDGTKIKASQTFWDEVKKDEGLIGTNGKPALKAYKLGDGRITIGWGHTGSLSGPTPKIGDTITTKQAQTYLQNDATEAANCVRRMLGEWKKQGLNTYMVSQNMFDVLVSLVFNAGCQGLRTSKFIQLVKKGEYKKAANLLPKDTTMINGKFSKGLTARRKKESKRFLQ